MTTLISYKKTKVSLIITLNIIAIIWKQNWRLKNNFGLNY